METKISAFLAQTGSEPTGNMPGAWLVYRIEAGRLVRPNLPVRVRGGLMGITAAAGGGDRERLAREISMECGRRGMSGVLWDLPAGDPEGQALAASLAPRLRQRGLWQLAPLHLAGQLPQARVLVPAAVSGGSYGDLLSACRDQLGTRRCCLELPRICSDFCMPARDSDGVRLEHRALAQLLEDRGGESWFSPELCCRYFTYTARGETHFVLFDDLHSAGARLRQAAAAGFTTFLIRWKDWGPDSLRLLEPGP